MPSLSRRSFLAASVALPVVSALPSIGCAEPSPILTGWVPFRGSSDGITKWLLFRVVSRGDGTEPLLTDIEYATPEQAAYLDSLPKPTAWRRFSRVRMAKCDIFIVCRLDASNAFLVRLKMSPDLRQA